MSKMKGTVPLNCFAPMHFSWYRNGAKCVSGTSYAPTKIWVKMVKGPHHGPGPWNRFWSSYHTFWFHLVRQKPRKFHHVQSKVKILINMNIQFSSSFCFLIFCLSPKFIWFPKLLLQLSFLVFPNVFGPPTTVAVVVDFKDWATRGAPPTTTRGATPH